IWDRFAKLLFDWFRAPALEVHITDSAEWASIRKIGFHPLARMTEEEEKRFLQCLETYTSREWRDTKGRTPARYTFATLVDPHEELPPSEIS
ncbi:MAG: RimK family alpha-L-glutamate ligase, partial [Mesorhizobium sp.]